MKKLFLPLFCLFYGVVNSQICDPTANIVLFSNYDGGVLTIDVDVNIPNLKIGIVSYEADSIILTGSFVSNVTEVYYAGYDSPNNHCSMFISQTSISGAPVSATTNIVFAPSSTLANTNGYSSVICAYSCDNSTNQGGCNTVDQVEDYFINQFNGTIYSHKVQYGCWSGIQSISDGGSCCPSIPLSSVVISTSDNLCLGDCNGSATVSAIGGLAPYTYTWSPGSQTGATINGLCAGTYTVVIEDANGDTTTETIVISEPLELDGIITAGLHDAGNCEGELIFSGSGGTIPYAYIWDLAANSQTTATADSLCAGVYCLTITDANNCSKVFCDTVISTVGIDDPSEIGVYLYPNPVNSILNCDITGLTDQANYRIMDPSGRIVLQGRLKQGLNQIDMKSLNNGMYSIIVFDSKGTTVKTDRLIIFR